jgi:hypothetical protein
MLVAELLYICKFLKIIGACWIQYCDIVFIIIMKNKMLIVTDLHNVAELVMTEP